MQFGYLSAMADAGIKPVACWEDCCLDCDHDSGTTTGLSIESLDSVLASSMDPIDYLLTVHSGDACLLT